MADSLTTNYDFILPEVGASDDTWGDKLNLDLTRLDDMLGATFNAPSTPDGTLGSLKPAVKISGTAPFIDFVDTSEVLPAGVFRLRSSSDGFRLIRNTAVSGDFSTSLSGFRWINNNNFHFDVPVFLNFDTYLLGSQPTLYITETNVTDPAGRFRFTGSGGNFYLQRSTTAGVFASANIFRYLGPAPTDRFTIYPPTTLDAGAQVNGDLLVTGQSSGATGKFGALAVGVDAGDQYITSDTGAIVFKELLNAAPAASSIVFYFRDSANTTMAGVYGAGTAAANAVTLMTREKGDLRYTQVSSQRFKTNITPAVEADLLAVFDSLPPIKTWTWGGEIPPSDARHGDPGVGFIAEEVDPAFPAGVVRQWVPNPEPEGADTTETRVNGLDPLGLIAVLAAKIKYLETLILEVIP